MRTRWLYILPILAMLDCGWRYNFRKPEVADADAQRRFAQDRAACTERGAALQTYSGGWGVYQGSGGGSSSSRFNAQVYVTCMQGRGWDFTGSSPTFLGMALY